MNTFVRLLKQAFIFEEKLQPEEEGEEKEEEESIPIPGKWHKRIVCMGCGLSWLRKRMPHDDYYYGLYGGERYEEVNDPCFACGGEEFETRTMRHKDNGWKDVDKPVLARFLETRHSQKSDTKFCQYCGTARGDGKCSGCGGS